MADETKDGAKSAADTEKPADKAAAALAKKDEQIARLKEQLKEAKAVADEYQAEVAELQGKIDSLTEPPPPPIQVRATRPGWYNQTRQRVGAEFTLADMKDFSKQWMELIEPEKAAAVDEFAEK